MLATMIIMLIAFYEKIKSFYLGIVYIINGKINENAICFVLFFQCKTMSKSS